MVESLKKQVKVLTEECIKANRHILDISLVRGESGKYFGTDKIKQQFQHENAMMLTSQGFSMQSEPKSAMLDENSLPPLSHLATPEQSRKIKTHTDQFFESDMKNKLGSNTTSPKLRKLESEDSALKESARSKNYFNAEAAKKIEEAKEAAFERIMHSANIVKEVLQRNMNLSEDLVKNNQIIDNLNQEIFQLQRENEDIRERLEILETITGKDSSILLNKLRCANQTLDPEDQDDTLETEERRPREEIKQFNEKELMLLLTDEHNSDDFMLKNKQSIINALYQLGKEKQILAKRIENLEKSKIRKTHMKLRMTKNEFYQQEDPNVYNGNAINEHMRFKATLDEGVDDAEPIRSILNEEDLFLQNKLPPRLKKGAKIKMTKQISYKDKRIIPLKKRHSDNESSKSEIRNASSFNYGSNFRRTRESFLEPSNSGSSNIVLPNPHIKQHSTGRKVGTNEGNKTTYSYLTNNTTTYNTGNTSALNFENSLVYNPHRLKKSPYEILNYDQISSGLNRSGKQSINARKFSKKKKL
jgi:hypothetical protein